MYQVFQDGKPCSSYSVDGWDVDTFETKREAEVFAFLWAYPFTLEQAEKTAPSMDLDKGYDFSMGEFPVVMSIRVV